MDGRVFFLSSTIPEMMKVIFDVVFVVCLVLTRSKIQELLGGLHRSNAFASQMPRPLKSPSDRWQMQDV